jgi:hypothetical protein
MTEDEAVLAICELFNDRGGVLVTVGDSDKIRDIILAYRDHYINLEYA